MATFDLLNHGLLTAFTSKALGTVDAGDVGSTITADLWFRKDTPGGTSGQFWLHAQVFDSVLGRYVDSGKPSIDRKWVQARITGLVNPLGVVQAPYDGPWTNLGSNGGDLLCPSLAGNCAWVVEFRFAPGMSSGSPTETPLYAFHADYSDATTTYTNIVPRLGSGILTGLGDLGINEWIDAPVVTSAGAVLTVGACSLLNAGMRRNFISRDITFDATSGSGALTAGQEYQALVTQPLAGGALVTTKGNAATAGASVPPTMPADSLLVDDGLVTVPYGVASLSLAGHAYSGRGRVVVDSGLNLLVNPMRALFPGRPWEWRDQIPVTVDDDTTTYLWASSSGSIAQAATQAPATLGDALLAKAVAAGSVATLTDLRTFLEPNRREIRLKYLDQESAGTQLDVAFVAEAMTIDRISVSALVAGSGASGATVFDVNRVRAGSSVTLFTNQGGSPETRPSIAANDYVGTDGFPEVTDVLAGDAFVLDLDTASTGGTRASFFEVVISGAPCR